MMLGDDMSIDRPGISDVTSGLRPRYDPKTHSIEFVESDVRSNAYGEFDYDAHNAAIREKIEAPWRAEVERLREALTALYRAADLYQATIRPSVHGLSVERVHKLRAERLEPLLDVLGAAREALDA